MGGERKNQRGGPQALLREQNRESSQGTLASVPCSTWSGWGGQAQHCRQEPTGCVPFSWSEVLRRGCRGGSGRGSLFGQWAQSQPYRFHFLAFLSSPGFMSSVQLLSAQVVPLGGADIE